MSSERGLEATRAVREALSREFGNDPRALVEHYLSYQKRFSDRLRDASAPRQASKQSDAAEQLPNAG